MAAPIQKLPPTEMQQAVLDFVVSFMAKENMAPTVTEIALGIDRSRASVEASLRELGRKGYLKKTNKRERNLTLMAKARKEEPKKSTKSQAKRVAVQKGKK